MVNKFENTRFPQDINNLEFCADAINKQESCTYLISPGHGDEGRLFVLIFWHDRSAPSLSLIAPLGCQNRKSVLDFGQHNLLRPNDDPNQPVLNKKCLAYVIKFDHLPFVFCHLCEYGQEMGIPVHRCPPAWHTALICSASRHHQSCQKTGTCWKKSSWMFLAHFPPPSLSHQQD